MKAEPLAVESIALLREIRDELRGLRADLAQRRSAVDPALCTLLRELHAYTGTAVAFCSAELLAVDDPILREALAGLDATGLSRLLGRLEGHWIGNLRLTRVGRDESGVVWSIVADER